jgi:uncharacterized protein YidB (DUF937 family)
MERLTFKFRKFREVEMSNRAPSMTALLGLLAVAGYQNRDKIAEMIRSATASAPSDTGTQSAPLGGLLGNLGGMLGAAGAGSLVSGGLGELLAKFQQSGHGDTVQSWVSNGPNQPISPQDLKQAVGSDVLVTLEQQTGLSEQEILARLSQELPGAVDKYTPEGQLPQR